MSLWRSEQDFFYTCAFWLKYAHLPYIRVHPSKKKNRSFISIRFMMKTQLTFRRAQQLTRELQRVLEEVPPNLTTTSTRTKFTSDVL